MTMQDAIRAMLARDDLSAEQMTQVMHVLMTGEATQAQIGGFLIGLRMKGETIEEITAAAQVMRRLATPVRIDGPYLVDTCGTGGDGKGTFNISTAAALVAAAAGARVVKHGNRSVSSRSGSADVLAAAGVNLEITPAQVAECVNEIGVGFLFAPQYHGAMKHAVGPRREVRVRTVFNVLGPLTNPARAPNQVIGVFDPALTEVLADVLRRLGSRHVLVVHSEDGMDEISCGAATRMTELRDGGIRTDTIEPAQFGLPDYPVAALSVDSPEASLRLIRQALSDDDGAARTIVALNAGAAIYVSGRAPTLADGVARAGAMMSAGGALDTLDALVARTQRFCASQ